MMKLLKYSLAGLVILFAFSSFSGSVLASNGVY